MSDKALTPQQQAAVDARGTSIVLSSVAGCGKTRVLTERYVSHLVRDRAAVSEIIAFTFTDKAAREMRKRIRKSVRQHLLDANDDADRQRWRDQERDLETANIGTIHAFCTQLLQRFALAAGLDPAVEVLDETVAPSLRDKAVRDALYALLEANNATGDSLRELARWYGWHTTREGIEMLLLDRDSSNWQQWIDKPNEEWVTDWLSRRQSRIDDIENSTDIANAWKVVEATSPAGPKSATRIAEIVEEHSDLPKAKKPETVWARLHELARVSDVERKWPDQEAFAAFRDSMKLIRETIKDDILPLFAERGDLMRAAEFGRHFLRVALACQSVYAGEKHHRGAIDFDDQLIMARDLLSDHRTVRNVCQSQYKFLLVDELQDTDPVQMEIVELLVGKGLTTGKLFAVGDANQSIYRFRGADVSLFSQLRERVGPQGQMALTTNFRSQPAILHFVNALLCQDVKDYEPLLPVLPQLNPNPCVESLWTPTAASAPQSRDAEAKCIAERIKQMLSESEKLVRDQNSKTPKLRPVEAKDIVLLFRAMSNVATYESALTDAKLDYYVVGGRAFYAKQEIYDVLNLLQALGNPLDALSLAGVLRSPFGCISDDGLYQLARHPQSLWAALTDATARGKLVGDDRAAAERIAKWLLSWRELKDRLPIAALLNRILADSGYDAALQFEPLGERKLANLWKLIDQARAFDSAGGFTLDDFVRRLEDLVTGQPREEQAATQPEESNVIRLMSIHQAKGLEFPVVILPDFNGKTRIGTTDVAVWDRDFGCVANPPNEEPLPFPKFARTLWQEQDRVAETAEELRVLYVACTRAADYLIISGTLDDQLKAQNERMRVLANRFDVTTGSCKASNLKSNQLPHVRVTETRSQSGT